MLREIFCSKEYKVSDQGYVIGKRGQKLKGSLCKKGYLIAHLMIDGKRREIAIHILVARAFCAGYQKGLQVNHKNGNKQDNKASNLEWVTRSENMVHAEHVLHSIKHAKGAENPSSKAVDMIDKNTKKLIRRFNCTSDAAKYLGASNEKELAHKVTYISRAAKGLRKTTLGYKWRYTQD